MASAQIFTDGNFQGVGTDGLVVPNGKLYIYDNATGLLATTYQDSAQTITNVNPVILSASGKAKVFLSAGTYDITLKTSADATVWTLNDYIADDVYSKSESDAILSARTIGTIAALRTTVYSGQPFVSVTGYYTAADNIGVREYYWDAASTEADNGGTVIQVTGVATGRWKMKYSGAVNVDAFGAKADGTDDSVAIQAALDSLKEIDFSAKTYLCNVVINNKAIIRGAGSSNTKIYPFDINKAAMIYGVSNNIWDYPSKIYDIGFYSTAKTGIGFAFGKDAVASYVSGDQLKRNLTFHNCYFSGFDKAVFAPFGAIGESFYSCGFSSNKYGLYAINDKTGTTNMHAGNKYFYDGEFSQNDCAVYIHNAANGFGGVVFNGTIFEFNRIALYHYTSAKQFQPTIYNDCWFESNGSLLSAGTTTIDAWTGAVRSDQVLNNNTIYADGVSYIKFNGGRPTGINCIGSGCVVTTNGSEIANTSGYLGEPFVAATGSYIKCDEIVQAGPLSVSKSVSIGNILSNQYYPIQIDSDGAKASHRVTCSSVPMRLTDGYQANTKTVLPLNVRTNTSAGSFTLVGTTVTDGTILGTCNEYTRAAFLGSEYTSLATMALPIGYTVFSYDIKCTAGAVITRTWNRSTYQGLGAVTHTAGDGWRTVRGIVYSSSSIPTIYGLDFNGTGVDATWRVGGFQAVTFDTLVEALAFLNTQKFIMPKGTSSQVYENIASVATATPWNSFDLTSFQDGTYSYWLSLDSPNLTNTTYIEAGTIHKRGTVIFLDSVQSGANSAVALSGQIVQYTQTSGSTQNVYGNLRKCD